MGGRGSAEPRPPLPAPPSQQIPVSENYAVVVQNPLLYNVRALLLGQVSSHACVLGVVWPSGLGWAGCQHASPLRAMLVRISAIGYFSARLCQ